MCALYNIKPQDIYSAVHIYIMLRLAAVKIYILLSSGVVGVSSSSLWYIQRTQTTRFSFLLLAELFLLHWVNGWIFSIHVCMYEYVSIVIIK